MSHQQEILQLLNSSKLTASEFIKYFQSQSPDTSPRAIRNTLNIMVKEGSITRAKHHEGKKGKPHYIYSLSTDFKLLEGNNYKIKITTKDDIMWEMLPYEEKERHFRGMNALLRLKKI